MILLLNESFPAGLGPACGRIELFAAACLRHERAVLLREWIGHEYHPDPHGRPVSPHRSISISHTPTILVLAMRASGRIGVDVEAIPALGDLSPPFPMPQGVSRAEKEHLLALPPAERALAFTRLWTAKESLSKAFGLGNSMDLSQIELHDDGQDLKFARLYEKAQLATGWMLAHRRLETASPAVVAIAWDQTMRNP